VSEEGAPAGEGGHELPPFAILCLGLYSQAQVSLGLQPDPTTNQTAKDLPTARQAIDLLGVLEAKTKGNLTSEESSLLAGVLSELRFAYVQASK
jgi:hypothetical protein